jgi:8-oxo-dGTP diphosphatase
MQKRQGSHGEGTWSIPGGHLEFGESFEAAATREVSEETGMEIENIQYFATTNDVFSEGKHYVTVWLRADWKANEP